MPLPLCAAPNVRFPPGFARRLELLVRRAAGARERAELFGFLGRARASGPEGEFAGHRPYRAGEDVRHLDCALLARGERPFVRMYRREAGERWLVLLDASASMGLGRPGKLELAAELALALAALGQRFGATVELLAARPGASPLSLFFARRADLSRWLAALEQLEAASGQAQGLRELLPLTARGGRTARLFLVGDLGDLEPGLLLGLQRPGRRLDVVHLLAPHELDPASLGIGAAVWIDREDRSSLETSLAEGELARYRAALSSNLEAWRARCARHGIAYSTWTSDTPFEDVARAVLGL